MAERIRVAIRPNLAMHHQDLLVEVAKALKAAGAPVHHRLAGFEVVGWERAAAKYELVIERGVVVHHAKQNPYEEIFEWREE